MQLIYRGHSYTCTSTHVNVVRHSRAINWRYRLPKVAQVETLPMKLSTTSRAVQSCAINWRFQVPSGV